MLERYLNIGLINTGLAAKGRDAVISELAALIAKGCPDISADKIAKAIQEREDIDSTGIEKGIAIPHAKVDGINALTIAIGISKDGVNFGSHDDHPTHLFFVLLAPPGAAGEHMKVLARMAKVLLTPGLKEKILEAKNPEDVYLSLVEAEKEL